MGGGVEGVGRLFKEVAGATVANAEGVETGSRKAIGPGTKGPRSVRTASSWDQYGGPSQGVPSMKDNQSRPDNPRRVFSVPCQLQVECTLFVLATDLTHARHALSLVDLQHFLTFD